MTLIRWTPLRDISPWHSVNDLANEFAGMQHDIDRLFDGFRGGSRDEDQTSLWLPPVDVVERDNDYFVKVELPGVNKEDVKITLHKDVLTIKGEKKRDEEKKGNGYQRIERSYGTFQRSFTLPSSVLSDKIEASYNNGVLTLSLPKVEEVKPKEIEVKVK